MLKPQFGFLCRCPVSVCLWATLYCMQPGCGIPHFLDVLHMHCVQSVHKHGLGSVSLFVIASLQTALQEELFGTTFF